MSNWKLDDNGNIVLKDGNPVYVDGNNTELSITVDKIKQLNNEAMTQRVAKEALEAKLKVFDGLDASEARLALETVATMNKDGGALTNDKVNEMKASIIKQHQLDMAAKDEQYKNLKTQHDNLLIDNAFSSSDFVKNNIAVPVDMFQATFRNNFKIENGELIVVDKQGQRFYSKENLGHYADVNEGLRMLVESHPSRDQIIKANVPSGSGSNGAGGTVGGAGTISRSELESKSPLEQKAIVERISKGELKIV